MAIKYFVRDSALLRRRLVLFGTMNLDNSYPAGGYSFQGLYTAHKVAGFLATPKSGYEFFQDYPTQKVKVMRRPEAPQRVYEEVVAVTSNVGRLKYKAAFIQYIGNTTKSFDIMDKATTPGAGEVAVDLKPTDGGSTKLTFAGADSVTSVKVTYYPAESNRDLDDTLVISDVVNTTPASGHASRSGQVITITGAALAILSVDVDGTLFKPIIDDDTPVAGEYALNWLTGGNTTLTGSGTEFSGATSIKITFIKAVSQFTTFEDQQSHSSDVVTLTKPYYLLRTACYLYTDDNDVPHQIRTSDSTLAANQVKINPSNPNAVVFTYEGATDVVNSGIDYLLHNPQLLTRDARPVEVYNAADMSAITGVEFTAFLEN